MTDLTEGAQSKEVIYHQPIINISRDQLLELLDPIAGAAGMEPGDILTVDIDSNHIRVVRLYGLDNSDPNVPVVETVQQVLMVSD